MRLDAHLPYQPRFKYVSLFMLFLGTLIPSQSNSSAVPHQVVVTAFDIGGLIATKISQWYFLQTEMDNNGFRRINYWQNDYKR